MTVGWQRSINLLASLWLASTTFGCDFAREDIPLDEAKQLSDSGASGTGGTSMVDPTRDAGMDAGHLLSQGGSGPHAGSSGTGSDDPNAMESGTLRDAGDAGGAVDAGDAGDARDAGDAGDAGDAAVEFDEPVDGFGAAVGRAVGVEVAEELAAPSP